LGSATGVLRVFSAVLTMLSVAAAGAPATATEKPLPDLVAVGAPMNHAELVAIDSGGELKFRDAGGQSFPLPASDLVRWSNPAPLRAADAIIFTDGTRLGLAAAWGKEPAITFDGQRGVARTTAFGRVEFERSEIAAVHWRLPPDETRQTQIIDEFSKPGADEDDSDWLLLDNGDRISGTLTGIGPAADRDDGDAANATVTFVGDLGQVELPLDRLRGVRLSRAKPATPLKSQASARLLVGLRDGSLIVASALRRDGDAVIIVNPVLGELQLGALSDVGSLQGVGKQIAYLSDVEPASYRHDPYLDLAWKYNADRNALGGPLRADSRTYLKGLGLHSASRMTFDLEGTPRRFAATIALDDGAIGGGSVVFRVLLKSDDGGEWREAFSSGVFRGDDPPREVAVDLTEVKQLALVVEYADRGDERDYANWLDARLERRE
jgi:hypothetical protein